VEAFRAGAAAEHVHAVLAAEGLRAPPELISWFGWHDGATGPTIAVGPGVAEAPESALVDHWYVLTLADAVRVRRSDRESVNQDGDPELEPESWFPVLHFTRAAFLALDTQAGGDAPAPLFLVDPSGGMPGPPPLEPRFSSLTDLVRLIIRLFDDGLVSPDPEDPRLPSLRDAPLSHPDVHRLLVW
jgi:hypothetical protein